MWVHKSNSDRGHQKSRACSCFEHKNLLELTWTSDRLSKNSSWITVEKKEKLLH
ncbi:hypothetical protein ILYODFUR_005471, partial [Ilyodon furcidens]